MSICSSVPRNSCWSNIARRACGRQTRRSQRHSAHRRLPPTIAVCPIAVCPIAGCPIAGRIANTPSGAAAVPAVCRADGGKRRPHGVGGGFAVAAELISNWWSPGVVRWKRRCGRRRRTIRGSVSSVTSGGEKTALLASADHLVIPSLWYENAPVAVIEAAAYGLGVVAAGSAAFPNWCARVAPACCSRPATRKGWPPSCIAWRPANLRCRACGKRRGTFATPCGGADDRGLFAALSVARRRCGARTGGYRTTGRSRLRRASDRGSCRVACCYRRRFPP